MPTTEGLPSLAEKVVAVGMMVDTGLVVAAFPTSDHKTAPYMVIVVVRS